jgi:hypothetical protein
MAVNIVKDSQVVNCLNRHASAACLDLVAHVKSVAMVASYISASHAAGRTRTSHVVRLSQSLDSDSYLQTGDQIYPATTSLQQIKWLLSHNDSRCCLGQGMDFSG